MSGFFVQKSDYVLGLSEYRMMYFDGDAITGDITTMVY